MENVNVDKLKVMDVLHARTSQKQSGLQFEGRYAFDDLKTEGEAVCQWQIRPEGVGIGVKGHLAATVEMECVRCLSPYKVPIEMNIDEKYVFEDYIDTNERERELTGDDFYEVVDQQGELDLKDLVHQFLILETSEHEFCNTENCQFTGVRSESA